MTPVLLYFASSIMKSEPQHYQKHSVLGICQHFNPLSNKEFSAGFTFNMHTTLYTTISIYAYQQQNVSKFHCCHAYVVYWYSPCVQKSQFCWLHFRYACSLVHNNMCMTTVEFTLCAVLYLCKIMDFECDICASLFRSHTVLINSKCVGLPVWHTDWTIAWKYVYDRTRVTHWSPIHLVVMHTRTSAHDWINHLLNSHNVVYAERVAYIKVYICSETSWESVCSENLDLIPDNLVNH